MVPVVLSILLVVLLSGAVLWVVAGDHVQPTSGQPGADRSNPEIGPAAPTGPATPATPIAAEPARESVTAPAQAAPVPSVAPGAPAPPGPPASRPAIVPVRMSGPPIPAHRIRSGAFLLLLAVCTGLLTAIVIGALVTALAFALRAAVTS